jgi:hypothetical protein
MAGETVEGHVRITPERIVVVNADRALVLEVAATNVAQIYFPSNVLVPNFARSSQQSLPANWHETDIGHVGVPGSTRFDNGSFTLRSAGMNLDGESDSFHFVYKTILGDSEIVAAVPSIHFTHPNAKAGLMMRENLNEYSRNVALVISALNGGALQYRATERGPTEGLVFRNMFAPLWLKLKRKGNEFTAFASPNGRVWSLVEKASIAMSENIYVGLALTSARDDVLNWTTFDKVREAPKLMNEEFTPEVELTSGSIVSGRPAHADGDEFFFSGAPKVIRVPTARVARISFQPLTDDIAFKTRMSRPGVWVKNGDFFDGEFQRIDGANLTISSVLYGLRTFDMDDDVLALVLHGRKPFSAQYEMLLADGSVLYASGFSFGDGELKLKEAALGEVRVPAFEIVELHRR